MIHYNTAFQGLKKEQIEKWLTLYKHRLIGSAVFVKGSGIIAELIQKVCSSKAENKSFIPSHVGSLIEIGGQIYLFDMKPPRGTIRPFDEYILNSKDEFMLVMRDFELDTEKFSADICARVNKSYGYLSAIQSAFKYLWWGYKEHCSEIHLKELQEQGLFESYDANETTPEDLLNILLNKSKKTVKKVNREVKA